MTDKKTEIRNGMLDYMQRNGYVRQMDEESEAWALADIIAEGVVRSEDDG